MDKNLPIKYKEGFFSKFINNIKRIFFKNKHEKEVSHSKIENVEKEKNTKSKMLNDLKINLDFNYSNEYEKKQFMKKLSEDSKLLENFSNERLIRILQWYKDENEKKREILKKINA